MKPFKAFVEREGYVMEYWRGRHPLFPGKYEVKQHRRVLAEKLGRALTNHEIVHHINGDRTDNRLENLQIITHSQHMTNHWKDSTYRKAQRTRWDDPKFREKVSLERKGRRLGAEQKQLLSEIRRAAWKKAEFRAKVTQGLQLANQKLEVLTRKSEAQKRRYAQATPEARARWLAAQRTPEIRQKRSKLARQQHRNRLS